MAEMKQAAADYMHYDRDVGEASVDPMDADREQKIRDIQIRVSAKFDLLYEQFSGPKDLASTNNSK